MFNIEFGLACRSFMCPLCCACSLLFLRRKLFRNCSRVQSTNACTEKALFIFGSFVLIHNGHCVFSSKSLLCLADYCLIIASTFFPLCLSSLLSLSLCDNLNTCTKVSRTVTIFPILPSRSDHLFPQLSYAHICIYNIFNNNELKMNNIVVPRTHTHIFEIEIVPP